MTTQTLTVLKKNLNVPEETTESASGKIEFVNLEEAKIARLTFRPGWRWSSEFKTLMGSDRCPSQHLLYVIRGRLMIQANDRTEFELSPGDVAVVPAGHDAWVLGTESFVAIDFTGMREYSLDDIL
jgi:mannose-6-phosphate isomerase-like protein (cupin superfamily)